MQVLASLSATTLYCESQAFDDTRLDSQLQGMLSALQRLSLMKICSNEHFLTCGLVAFAFQLRRLRALNLFHDPPLRTFIKVIPSQEKPDSEREQKCMIWISISVAGALSLRTIRMPGTHLVLDRLFHLYPSILSWLNLEPILKMFFHTPMILTHWRKVHESGVARYNQVKRIAARQQFNTVVPLIDLDKLSDKSLEKKAREQEEEEEDEEGQREGGVQKITFEQMTEHTRGAPGALIDLMQATKCPFQARLKGMGYTGPMMKPHA